MSSINKSRISLTHFDENRFTVNPYSPENVIMKGNCSTFYDSDCIENTYL